MRAGMDAPVLQQLLERHARDLAAHAVEARQHDRVRRVVDDEVDAGEVLQRADVAALTADDAALHVVGRQLDDRHRRLRRVAGREALHRDGEDRAHAALGVALGLLLDLAHEARGVVADLVLDLAQQALLGLRRRSGPRSRSSSRTRARARARELLALGLESRRVSRRARLRAGVELRPARLSNARSSVATSARRRCLHSRSRAGCAAPRSVRGRRRRPFPAAPRGRHRRPGRPRCASAT